MDVPYDVTEHICAFLDSSSTVRLASTCKEYVPLLKRAKRQMRREEVLRCANILRTIQSALNTGDYVLMGNRDFDPAILLVLEFLWFHNMPVAYEWVDPELYNKIKDDDIPTLWKFSKKVCEITSGAL
jgi:hypothetical protein